jgi:hypothetical protein
MQHSIEFAARGPVDVTITTSGSADLDGFLHLNEELVSHSCFRPGLRILVDHSDLDTTTLDQDVRATGEAVARLVDAFRGSKIAVVAPDVAKYGLARASAEAADPRSIDLAVKVFVTRDEAEAWLWEQARDA